MRKFAGAAAAVAIAVSAAACGGGGETKNPDGTLQLDVAVTIERPCVKPGEVQRAVAKTEKGAQIGYLLTYPDGVPDKTKTAGNVDDKGVFVGEWVIPAGAPSGTSRVQIAAAKGSKVYKGENTFKIAGADGVCA